MLNQEQKVIRVFRDESFKIPLIDISATLKQKILDKWTYSFYNEKACKPCENFSDRHNDICDSCAAFKGTKATAKVIASDENPYKLDMLSVPRGSKKRLKTLLSPYALEYKPFLPRKHPFKQDIELTKPLRDYQVEAVDAIIDQRHGVIESPPRSGKCVVGSTLLYVGTEILAIEDLFKDKILPANEEFIWTVPADTLTVASLSGSRAITHLYSKLVDTTILLHTSGGRCLRGTPNHPVGRYAYGAIDWVALEDLHEGDSVITSSVAELKANAPLSTERITTLTVINEPVRVYDISVNETACFFGNGILSHNTLIATAAAIKIGLRTMIIAHQRDWLIQFQETFLGSPTQEGFTNAEAHQIGFPKKLADFKKYDISLCTFQQFMSKGGRELLEKIKNSFPTLIIDEVHQTPAIQTARVLSRFNTRYTIGLTGTPDRKTGDYVVTEDLVGPVVYKSKIANLKPTIDVVHPPGKYEMKGMGNAGFSFLISKLENNTPRRNFLVKEIIKRAEQGHLVLFPLTRVQSVLNYVRDINEQMGPGYALPFYGGLSKDRRVSTIADARQYKCKVIIGNINLLQTGLNIPRASCLFEPGINSNIPKAIQRYSRVLTPIDDKPIPTIVFTLDDCDVMRGCRRNEYWNALVPNFHPIVNRENQAALNDYFAKKKNARSNFNSSLLDGI